MVQAAGRKVCSVQGAGCAVMPDVGGRIAFATP